MKKRIAILLLAILLAFSSTSCADLEEESSTVNRNESVVSSTTQSKETETSATSLAEGIDEPVNGRGTLLTLAEDGGVQIKRLTRAAEEPMGEEGWTIFVYICGSDLESEGGSATSDLQEMLDADLPENCRFIVQTGGANSWENEIVSADALQRYEITGGEISLLEEMASDSMGQTDTLTSFLSWGLENYAANNMGLVFWNHGSGSINGVCFDEKYDSDSLTLEEIDGALAAVYGSMTDRFSFIGFDACLMATLETANMLVPYARYMVASEELEPGNGWDYTAIGNAISEKTNITGDALGKIICDSFYASYTQSDEESMVTLAVLDLSTMDTLIHAFDGVAENMAAGAQEISTLGKIIAGIKKAQNYGGNTPSEGYTNMIDLGDMLTKISDEVEGTDAVLAALQEVCIYQVKGASRKNAYGLSVYYPLSFEGSEELQVFRNICVSGAYLSFIDRLCYGTVNGTMEDYTDKTSDAFWSAEEYNNETWNALANAGGNSLTSDENCAVTLSEDPYLNEDGVYTFTVSSETLDALYSVQCAIYMDSEIGRIYCGTDNDVFIDWDTGVVEDNFGGLWTCLDDGQPLLTYLIDEQDDFNLYSVPVLLNGEKTNLRISYSYEEEAYTVLGAWNGIDETTGLTARDMIPVVDGDTIVPLYLIYDEETGELEEIEGEDYTVEDSAGVLYDILPAGDYYYSFILTDVYDLSVYTEEVLFGVDENGDVYYYTED